ncbi:dephospho-CoA kinase [Pseudokineococcus sp. 1T1Z-3]|uniref:dephospho-CoA kinase n=1 Tax=Pseudokineococcus sp. 1T1Z-3 TaxID=3132745 RepID=UPI0030ABCEB3
MLRVGLTGGTGAGKSTAARRLAELGAVVVDADALAREVLAVGTPGLAAVVAEFGDDVLAPDGSLDRPALGRVVFGDAGRRRALEAITHPLVRERREALVAAAPVDAVVVDDIPLLVESGRAAHWPLVVVVDAPLDVRVARLVATRGMAEEDARSRAAAQASDEERRAAADVLLDNAGDEPALRSHVDALWHERLVPFERNLRAGRPAPLPSAGAAVDADPADPVDPARAERLLARVRRAAGERARSVVLVGPRPAGGAAHELPEVLVLVDDAATADDVADDLRGAGLVRLTGAAADERRGGAGPGALAVGADPAGPVVCVVRGVAPTG